MKLGFVFDVRFTEYNGNYYSTNLPASLLRERYLKIFDEMVVIGRCIEVDNPPSGKLVQSNGEGIEFRCVKDENPIKRIFSYKKENEFIRKALLDCDVVICRGWPGTNISKEQGKRYLFESVSCSWDAFWNHSLLGKCVAPFAYILTKKAVYDAPYVLYVTSEFLQRRYPTKGQSVGVSDVALTTFDDAVLEKRKKRIRELYVSGRDIVLGTAAAVNVKYKGQRNVIEALSMLKKMGLDNYRYVLAGGGNQEQLRSLAVKYGVKDQVVFVGSVTKDRMPEWYDGIDVYIQPSLQEGLPRALVEAMSRGLPALGSKTGGIPELLEPQYVCRSNRNMAQQIVEMLQSLTEEKMLQMAERNYEESKKYDAELLASRRDEFLRKFAENR